MARLTKASISLLGLIVAAMDNTATPYHMVTAADAKPLVDAKLVETNSEITDGDKLAARATEAGIAKAKEAGNTTATAPVSSVALNTGRFDLSKLPAKKSRSSGTYPFETMGVGDDFVIEATDDRPDPAKSMASTVSGANKKFGADKPEAERRTFQLFPVEAGGELAGVKFDKKAAVIVRTA